MDERCTGVAESDYHGNSFENRSMAQSLDLVGDKVTSPLVPLPVLLDLDLETRVPSSEAEEDSPPGDPFSTTSAAAFLAAARTLGLSILT